MKKAYPTRSTVSPGRTRATLALALTPILLLGGCGGGSSSNGGDPGTGPGTTPGITPTPNDGSVAAVLESFGIDTTPTPRADVGGTELPDDFAPLGTTETVNRFEELVLFGAPLDAENGPAGTTGGLSPAIDFDLDGTDVRAELLADAPGGAEPWFADTAVRGATFADVDADGLDEMLVVWQGEADAPVSLVVVQDVAEGGESGEPIVVATGTEVRALELASGDLDGDGSIDLAVALVGTDGAIEIVVLGNDGSLSLNGRGFSIDAAAERGFVNVAMVTGNVDRDAADELALAVSAYGGGIGGGFGNVTEASSRWFVLDDADTDLAELAGGRSVVETADGPAIARVADIALGDVDGDGLDEVVLGGLDRIGRQGDSGGIAPDYLVEIFDDARGGFASLGGSRIDAGLPRGGASGVSQQMYYLFVRTGDVDGDGAEEIITNQYVWDDLAASSGTLSPLLDEVASAQADGDEPVQVLIDTELLFAPDQRDYYFSPASVDVGVGDVTGDNRDDIVLWLQRLEIQSRRQGVTVLGLSQEVGFREYATVEAEFQNPQRSRGARLLLGDLEINGDTAALRLSGGSYRYELTEPVVLAVLAAAPCSTELGQDLSSCRTGIGNSATSGGSDTSGWAFVANVSVGGRFQNNVTQSSASIILRTRNEVRGYTTEAYRTTISVLRETGPIEDTVIFTSVPYDIWSYEVISHPQPELVGGFIDIRLPREPIQIMTTRELYNANTAPDAFKIDERVLAHTPGDPGSYPDAAQKNALLGRFLGIESDRQTVGLNTGRQTVTIEQFEETTTGRAYSFRVTIDAEGSAGGVVGGLEIGGGGDFDWSTVRGEGTQYVGQVAEIGPDNPISASYGFGLFAYYYEPDEPNTAPFEVLNYWVEDF